MPPVQRPKESMFFDDDDFTNNSITQERPHVQMHYTVTPIGGKAELAKWKLERQVIEKEWQARQKVARAKVRQTATEIVAGTRPQRPLTKEEQKGIDWYLKTHRTPKPPRQAPKKYEEYQTKLLKQKSFMTKVKDFIYKALFS